MGCLKQVRSGQLLLPVRLAGRRVDGVHGKIQERNGQIAPGELDPTEDILAEFLIDRRPVTPGLGEVEIVEELIEAGDLSRFQGLLGDQRSLQDSGDATANSGAREWIPCNAGLGVP